MDPLSFVIQLLIAAFVSGGVYGAIRADLKNMGEKIEREIKERIENDKEQFDQLRDLRDNTVGQLRADFNYLRGQVKATNHRDPEATEP